MLTRLQIQNFALIQNITLEFDPRLNVFTGETGAGKSILIDALCFALGERFDSSVILRTKPEESLRRAQDDKKNKTSVEAVFDIPKNLLKNSLLEPFIADEEVLILRREITSDGKNRAWINNRAVTNASLKDCGDLLINLHGQHDHQLLLNPVSHLEMLDLLSKTESIKIDYAKWFEEYAGLTRSKEELQNLQETRDREMDLLKYQINEIEKPGFQANEEEELNQERIRLANAEKLHGSVAKILQYLNDEEASVSNLLGRAQKELQFFTKLDPSMEAMKGDYENAQLSLEEIIRSLRDYQENLSFDSDRLEEIDKRLDQIDLVKRKYGGSLASALEFLKTAKEKYDKLLNGAVYEKDLDQKISKILPKLKGLAAELSEKRQKAGQILKKTIEAELKDLNITHAVFECKIEKKDFASDGVDQVEFMISLNPGQPVMPLAKIISGGEASRVMLAMKKALMKVDPVPTLIFDEIDANIGGRLGNVTGEKLKEIAQERQVLLITHLPQIASFADRHFKVSKKSDCGQTGVHYEIIEGEARVKELAQMMSGNKETDISKKHAQEMLRATR